MLEWAAVYLVGVVVSGMYCSYRFGTLNSSEQAKLFDIYVALVFLWPLLVVFIPLMAMYNLGTKEKTKRLEKEYKDAGLL